MFPAVNEEVCIQCGKCQKICPEFHPNFHPKAVDVTAAYAESAEVRQSGSSGGIFPLLAEKILAMGGKVWGAAFTNELQVIHQCASNVSELQPLLRSKYVQSNPSGAYAQIKEDVAHGIMTLFSGTPCQCNAVRNVVGDSPLLYTVEVVCHGVPSQDLFDRSIKWFEEKHNCTVTRFTFRSKPAGAKHPQAYSIEYACGFKVHNKNGLHYQFPYYFGFQKYMTLRQSCYTCKWAQPKRTADITLGDFWGIEKYNSTLDAKTGVSQVICNTEKGRELVDSLIRENEIFSENFPIDVAIENNGCLKAPTKLKPSRAAFFKALQEEPFDEVVKKYLTSNRKFIFDLYYAIPGPLRRIVRRLMDKHMSYE